MGHPAATAVPVATAVLAMMTGAEEAEEAGLEEGEEGAEGEGQRRNRKYQGFLPSVGTKKKVFSLAGSLICIYTGRVLERIRGFNLSAERAKIEDKRTFGSK
jgi:hypothetical protein